MGGSLRAGDPGVRLIEKAQSPTLGYFDVAVNASSEGLRVAPYYHLFGSDETSQRSEVIQTRMPQAYAMLNPQDAAALNLATDAVVSFSCAGSTLTLPVRLSDSLGQGLVGLPLGLPGISPVLVGERVENMKEATL